MKFSTLRRRIMEIERLTSIKNTTSRFILHDIIAQSVYPDLSYGQLLLYNKPEKEFRIMGYYVQGNILHYEIEMDIR